MKKTLFKIVLFCLSLCCVLCIFTACNETLSDSVEEGFVEHTHNWEDWTETKTPTCVKNGEVTRICSNNRTHTETRTVDALGHNFKNGECVRCGFKLVNTEGLIFTLNDKQTEYSITSYNGTSTDVVILPTYNNLPVTRIGAFAFAGCVNLTSISIPDSVTNIENSAFSNCSKLKSVTIPDSVLSIGSSVFRDCSNLNSITIPFVGGMKNGTSNTHFGYLFGANHYGDNNDFVPSSLKKVIITGSNNIRSDAFYHCSSINSVVIPECVTIIYEDAFAYCFGLNIVYYQGTAETWATISIAGGNSYLNRAKRYYYSETKPTNIGNYWHYDNKGNLIVW